ncbi:MAG: DUF6448 family protein [Balneolales bacterium]
MLLFGAFIPQTADAHCDALDGPVVTAAKEALNTGNVNLVLVWVLDEHDAEIREAFDRTFNVRDQNEEVRELADMYFFETLVRLHREGEGAPYTGLIPEGEYDNPLVKASDKALETGSLRELRDHLIGALETGLHRYYDEALALSVFDLNDVEGGREFVEAYVKFIHYVKPVHQAIGAEPGQDESSHSH